MSNVSERKQPRDKSLIDEAIEDINVAAHEQDLSRLVANVHKLYDIGADCFHIVKKCILDFASATGVTNLSADEGLALSRYPDGRIAAKILVFDTQTKLMKIIPFISIEKEPKNPCEFVYFRSEKYYTEGSDHGFIWQEIFVSSTDIDGHCQEETFTHMQLDPLRTKLIPTSPSTLSQLTNTSHQLLRPPTEN